MAALSAALSAPDAAPAAAPTAAPASAAAPIKDPDLGVYGHAHAVAAVAAVPGVDPKDVFDLWIKCLSRFLPADILPAYHEANPDVVSILSTFTYAGQVVACWGFGPSSSSTPIFPEGSAAEMTFFKLVNAVVTQLCKVWKTYTDWEFTGFENQSIFVEVVEQITSHFWPDWREYDADNA